MITLITGTPGSGKTALMVMLIMKAIKEGRPVFQHGIRDLKLKVEALVCGDAACEFCTEQKGNQINNFKDWVPPNALIVLDEVQRQFRNRPSSQQPPKAVVDMETHRHAGVDFIMATQSPGFIDQNIRKLIRMHHHLKAAPIGSLKYTWFECNNDPSRLGNGQSERFSPPKESFDQYKSAELHTKQRKPIPKALLVVAAGVLVASFAIYKSIDTLRSRVAPVAEIAAQSMELTSGIEAQTHAPPGFPSPIRAPGVNPDIFDKVPVVEGVLESAPAYASLVRVQDFPRIVACLSSETKCRCYTQQATVYATTSAFCRAYAAGEANSFDPYTSPARAASSSAAVARVE